jgi:hypothetical protein
MQLRIRTLVTLGAAAITAVAGVVAVAPPAGAAPPAPTVVVHMSSKSISLSTGHRVHAGRVVYKVVTAKGDLQVARLRNGYSLAQAGSDLPKAFNGDIKAIRRIDRNIVFRGGAETRPGKPGWFSVSLPAGSFVFIDQNSNAFTMVKVFGKAPVRQTVPTRGLITAYTYGFVTNKATLPHKGWVQFRNNADQPHFVAWQHVKPGTTNAQVRRFFKHPQRRPPFALPGSYTFGVLTQGQSAAQYINLKAGKYLIACYWPDRFTGMPHAFMGMWKLVNTG